MLTQNGEDRQALELYNKVLTEDPDDPYALAAGGWLEWNAGVSGKSAATERAGRASEEKAVRVAPQFHGGHLYLGLILLDQDDNAAGAIKQFTAFLADGSKGRDQELRLADRTGVDASARTAPRRARRRDGIDDNNDDNDPSAP